MPRTAVTRTFSHRTEPRSGAGVRVRIGRPMNGSGASGLAAFDA
jgi:hypothetical protein